MCVGEGGVPFVLNMYCIHMHKFQLNLISFFCPQSIAVLSNQLHAINDISLINVSILFSCRAYDENIRRSA